MQGRKIAEHAMGLHTREHRHIDYEKAASAIFTEPEIADVGLAEAEAFATGRKIRVTKVPYAAAAKALINDDPTGFVKILSDPGHRGGARRVDRGPARGRADLGHRLGGDRQPHACPTSSRAAWPTPPCRGPRGRGRIAAPGQSRGRRTAPGSPWLENRPDERRPSR